MREPREPFSHLAQINLLLTRVPALNSKDS